MVSAAAPGTALLFTPLSLDGSEAPASAQEIEEAPEGEVMSPASRYLWHPLSASFTQSDRVDFHGDGIGNTGAMGQARANAAGD
jgi:hypothetical protein